MIVIPKATLIIICKYNFFIIFALAASFLVTVGVYDVVQAFRPSFGCFCLLFTPLKQALLQRTISRWLTVMIFSMCIVYKRRIAAAGVEVWVVRKVWHTCLECFPFNRRESSLVKWFWTRLLLVSLVLIQVWLICLSLDCL